jgi:hypothetical protein
MTPRPGAAPAAIAPQALALRARPSGRQPRHALRTGDQSTSTPTTTDARWGHFKPSRRGQCKPSFSNPCVDNSTILQPSPGPCIRRRGGPSRHGRSGSAVVEISSTAASVLASFQLTLPPKRKSRASRSGCRIGTISAVCLGARPQFRFVAAPSSAAGFRSGRRKPVAEVRRDQNQ